MKSTVAELLAHGKGLLAADESFPSIEKRFKPFQIPGTEENRRAYRDMLFTTPGLSEFISRVILFDETLRRKTSDGIPAAQSALHHRARCNGLAVRGRYSKERESAPSGA